MGAIGPTGPQGAVGAIGPQGPQGSPGAANVGSVTAVVEICTNAAVQPTSALVYIPGHALSGYSDPTTGAFTFDNVPSGSYSVVAEQRGNTALSASVSPVLVTSGSTKNIGTIDISNYHTDSSNCGSCGVACASRQACVGGVCSGSICSSGYTSCSGACVSTLTDSNNCGACGVACGSGVCSNGVCTLTCVPGQTNCAGGCINLSTDANNCGACGRNCGFANGAGACQNATCTLLSCNAGFADCNLNPTDGCEVNLQSDPRNCGGCGASCLPLQSCSAGACH